MNKQETYRAIILPFALIFVELKKIHITEEYSKMFTNNFSLMVLEVSEGCKIKFCVYLTNRY